MNGLSGSHKGDFAPQIAGNDGGKLGAGSAPIRPEIDLTVRAIAGDDAFGNCPGQSILCVAVHHAGVGETVQAHAGSHIFMVRLGETIENRGELFAGDVIIWPIRPVTVAVDHAEALRPDDRI